MGEKGQKVQVSSNKVNKSWRCNVKPDAGGARRAPEVEPERSRELPQPRRGKKKKK